MCFCHIKFQTRAARALKDFRSYVSIITSCIGGIFGNSVRNNSLCGLFPSILGIYLSM